MYICIRYTTIDTTEADRIGYNGFLFPHSYSGEGRGARIGYNVFFSAFVTAFK